MLGWIPHLKLIAWDLDGTLYPRSEQLTQDIRQRIFDSISEKLSISDEEAQKYYQENHTRLHSSTKMLDEIGIDGHQFFTKLWDEIDLGKYIKRNHELALRFEADSGTWKHAILSNSNTLQMVERKLDLIGLSRSFFDPILTSVGIGYKKPDLRAFEHLVKVSKLDPEQILYVGDREHTDIIPAKTVGLRTCLVSEDREKRKRSQADVSVAAASEVFEFLERKK